MNEAPTEEVTVTRATRAELISFGALALNIATLVFGFGVIWADVQEHERRITAQEMKIDTLIPRIERIATNVEFLAERAREDRERSK